MSCSPLKVAVPFNHHLHIECVGKSLILVFETLKKQNGQLKAGKLSGA